MLLKQAALHRVLLGKLRVGFWKALGLLQTQAVVSLVLAKGFTMLQQRELKKHCFGFQSRLGQAL